MLKLWSRQVAALAVSMSDDDPRWSMREGCDLGGGFTASALVFAARLKLHDVAFTAASSGPHETWLHVAHSHPQGFAVLHNACKHAHTRLRLYVHTKTEAYIPTSLKSF